MERISPFTRKTDPPLSTYRLQINSSFGFSDARRVIPALHTLGITDCYVSSYLKAVHGSLNGYDIADPAALNPELGKAEVIAVVPRLVARLLREAPVLPLAQIFSAFPVARLKRIETREKRDFINSHPEP
ncbi:MAG: hypothetical protein MPW14_06030 [Candidatus Manganitrophus sp.]|nr:hypothetical protein [Candidatus Manganitrophus sp.]MDC4223018.1 hypothetical protein [Candidatus Manganitrophus sp.]WDT71374.1 MAG: hypothetical protein MPW17_00485 [Candidatus Manganitrophus sp.]WDT81300.1 MAG: hypothetical protein MPW14_06030 [Candidatus Manganitrophus sp.]